MTKWWISHVKEVSYGLLLRFIPEYPDLPITALLEQAWKTTLCRNGENSKEYVAWKILAFHNPQVHKCHLWNGGEDSEEPWHGVCVPVK